MIVEAHPFSQNSATQFTYQARPEWLILQQKFSTGITLPELRSIAFLLQQTLKLKKFHVIINEVLKASFHGLSANGKLFSQVLIIFNCLMKI